jgi:hypothetical protein
VAITVPQGVQGAVDDTNLPQLFADQGAIGGPSGVATGLAVSVATGTTRPVSIASGRALCGGALFVNSAAATLNLASNGTGASRTDVICAQVDWVAARTAFTNAGGVANLAAASAAAQAAAGSFVAIPLGQTPVQIPGTKWQEPLARQTVPAGATQLSGGTTDVRNLTRRSASVNFSSNWATNANYPLTLRKAGPTIRLAGRITRVNSTLASGDVTTFTIPVGFWPESIASDGCSTGGDSFTGLATVDNSHRLEIDKDGTASFRAGSAIAAGTNVHIDMTWIGA